MLHVDDDGVMLEGDLRGAIGGSVVRTTISYGSPTERAALWIDFSVAPRRRSSLWAGTMNEIMGAVRFYTHHDR
jgi:hypothetical protein